MTYTIMITLQTRFEKSKLLCKYKPSDVNYHLLEKFDKQPNTPINPVRKTNTLKYKNMPMKKWPFKIKNWNANLSILFIYCENIHLQITLFQSQSKIGYLPNNREIRPFFLTSFISSYQACIVKQKNIHKISQYYFPCGRQELHYKIKLYKIK